MNEKFFKRTSSLLLETERRRRRRIVVRFQKMKCVPFFCFPKYNTVLHFLSKRFSITARGVNDIELQISEKFVEPTKYGVFPPHIKLSFARGTTSVNNSPFHILLSERYGQNNAMPRNVHVECGDYYEDGNG